MIHDDHAGECRECSDLLQFLEGYLDGELTEKVRQDVLLHAQECHRCARLLRSLQRLVVYCHLEPNCEMPTDVRQQLWITIRRELYTDDSPTQP